MANSVNVSATNNADIDGLLAGTKWSGTISYSFPNSSSTYANPYSGGDGEPTKSGFSAAPTQMQAAINYAVALIQSYTNASITYNGTGSADIMVAQSPAANPTSYAYYPGNYAAGGDVWFGTQYDYTQAQLGNYYFTTALHELGHAFGLKHSQETTGGVAGVAVPSAHDDSEYTVMSYRSYVGGPLTGYTNEAYGYPQTYMANDILALQTLYGANYNTQSGNTVYTWSPTTGQEFVNGVGQLAPGGGVGGSANRIYDTIWDGNGVDTYDLSNYTTNLTINLNPGASSVFSTTQLAYLGNGHYASGNVYNAYLYNGDARSYIDNATGGSGNDTIIGNAIANVLNGGAGNDTITGGGGNDTIDGGTGTDTAVYSGNRANYGITYNASSQTFAFTDLRSGSPDGIDTITNVENFQFADGTLTSAALLSQLAPSTIEAIGTTSLVESGGYFYLNPTAGGTGPTLKDLSGSSVLAGQYSALAPLGAEQVGSGYDVAWKAIGLDQYTVWSVDSGGHLLSYLQSAVSGTSYGLEALETTFHQDLNGDGTIGVVTTVIEALGVAKLVQIANNYHLDPVAGGTGPTLSYNGVAVLPGQFAGCVPIGVEKTATGYEVAWKVAGTDQYGVWYTDSNGNYLSNIGLVSGSSSALTSLEPSFHQDLNGDGVIGVASASGTVIESAGSTTLTEFGNNYYFYTGGAGLVLKYQGAPVVDGQFPGVTPIGAEQTSTGYEVAWKVAGADQYGVWYTDSSGNYLSNIGLVSATSSLLQSLERSFQQDLNGDGTVGLPSGTTLIEAAGSTSLTQVGNNYFINPVAGGAGHNLMYNRSAVNPGQFGTATPIAAEQTATGYEVAWKVVGTTNYGVWYADSNGNYLSNIGLVSATSSKLESLETSFHQDLNGDGTIGVPAASPAAASALLQEHFAVQNDALADLMRSGLTNSIQSQHVPNVEVDANDAAGYLAHFLSAQSNANLFGH